ncbi:MAG TPA: hypothetical protein VNZ49_17200 [Bacteroidia bacterium]|jgi:hypothetical protein|nr:hypothetical protein [Bacteroidia bacterium]
MKSFLLLLFFTILTSVPAFSQTDTTSSSWEALQKQGHDKAQKNKIHKFGCSVFGGLGSGGNDKTNGFSGGGSARVHYNFHTLNAYAVSTNRLEYHGQQSDNPTLTSSLCGLTYGAGLYEDNLSLSAGLGIGYSAVRASTGGGISYKEYYYNKLGVCFSGQFSVHGKYIGFGFQVYYNFNSSGTDYSYLFGIEIRIW